MRRRNGMERIYLAYGSNLSRHQMAYRCPDAECIGTASIKDYRLLYKGSMSSAYLTIKRCRGHEVPVGVWKVTEDDEKSLDRYEGYPRFYYKKDIELEVLRNDGGREVMECFVYIMDEDRIPALPSSEYLHTCLEGYRDFGFDVRYLDEAYGYTARKARRHEEGLYRRVRRKDD